MTKLIVEQVLCDPWEHNGNYFQAQIEVSISYGTIRMKRRCKTATSLQGLEKTEFQTPEQEKVAAREGALAHIPLPLEHDAIPEIIKALQKAYNLKPMI